MSCVSSDIKQITASCLGVLVVSFPISAILYLNVLLIASRLLQIVLWF